MQPLWSGFAYKPHQEVGISWMLNREDQPESGGLLCDEMGLGKTMEILGLMKNSKKKQTLLLGPKAVISQWVKAATASHFNVMEVENGGWKLSSGRPKLQSPWFYITNYEKVPNNPSMFKKAWDRIVLDEAHRIRNANTVLFKAVFDMERKTLWAVTATPIVNSVKDMNNLFQLVGIKKSRLNDPIERLNVVAEACLHRSMEEMRGTLKELPSAPIITKESLDFATEEEGNFYRSIQGKIAARWKHIEHDNTKEMFVLLMRLRQLSLHPQVYISAMKRKSILGGYQRPDWDEPSTKFIVLKEKIEETPLPTKWIVFCQFHDEMEILQAYLESSPAVYKVSQYHGGLNDSQKDDVIESTKEPLPMEQEARHEILLLQLQSGGTGLNLQHFTKIIFMSPWWTSALMDQAVGRAVRIGQKETVEVTLLVLKEEETMNIDETMLNKAEEKRGMLEKVFLHASRGLVPKAMPLTGMPNAEADDAEEAEDPTN
jgi:SNF2 family DNA or RNA helicase